jgi:two-component system, NarL family, nitrate/nitrite response regulator NarL
MAATTRPVTVVLADDHPIYLDGVAAAVDAAEDLQLTGRCAGAEEALDAIRASRPDVAVVDLRMRDGSGLDVVRAVKLAGAPTRVIVLSAFSDGSLVLDALEAGAAGYLAKDASRREICEAIRIAAAGRAVVSASVQTQMASEIHDRGAARGRLLTTRELEMLGFLADGLSAPDIARRLFLGPSTVKSHLHHLYEKLGVSDRAAAVAEGMRRGLVR